MRLGTLTQMIVLFSTLSLNVWAGDNIVTVSSLADLAQAAAKSGQTVTMKPGMYRLLDYIPPSAIPERRQRGEFQFLTFGGSGNVVHLAGVTIEVDTALRNALHAPIHTAEFLVKGNNNALDGLTINDIGDGKSMGGAALGVTGSGNALRNCVLHVCGSFPYGYGDLFGKGGPAAFARVLLLAPAPKSPGRQRCSRGSLPKRRA